MIAPSPVLDGGTHTSSLGQPGTLTASTSTAADKPVLSVIQPDHSAIDYIGRWDKSHTASWAGSSLRFSFSGPLLFLVPGSKTLATDSPTVGWTVNGQKTYTAKARAGVSIRLWPPQGQVRLPFGTPLTEKDQTATMASTEAIDGNDEPKTIDITSIDWGSVLQIDHFQVLAGHDLSPTFSAGIADLPTMMFIGDSITSGFISHKAGSTSEAGDAYCGFLDAYPAHLRARLSSGVRLYALAFPGIKLVDSAEQEGMESKWFKAGPMETSQEWDFDERESEKGPTHIFVNLGSNDDVPVEKFLQTYEDFLNIVKETHGRRTGDILVIAPFGQWSEEKQKYVSFYPEMREMVEALKQRWNNEDPFASGDFPPTPMLELAKFHLDTSRDNSFSSISELLAHTSPVKSTAAPAIVQQDGPLDPSLLTSPRPSLLVRPSSVAAVSPTSKGTKAKLHFVDTEGWLDSRDDTFDGEHPTRQGAIKIARRLRSWLAGHEFLKK